MLEISHISKKYGSKEALHRGFEAEDEIERR